MSSLLFIAPADLGETVLATGALDYALHHDVQATIVCNAEAADLFRGAPNVSERHIIASDADFMERTNLWLTLAPQRFYCVIDARGSALGRVVRTSRRVLPQPSPLLRHRVEDWTDWMSADHPLAPKLWLDESARTSAAEIAPDAPMLLALAPGGVSAAKRWPSERFAAVARRLIDGPLAGAHVVLLGAADRDGPLIRDIAASLDADGVPALQLDRFDLLAAAALLERATLCVANDNVLAHLAAAANAPTLTLFGPTDERLRAPYGKRARTLRGRDYEAIMALPTADGRSQMEDISVDAVEAAVQDLLRAGGLS